MTNDTANNRIAALLRAATLEVYSAKSPAELAGKLPPGGDIYISYLPGDDWRKRVDIAAAVRAGGFNPVLHVPARQMLTREFLDDYMRAANAEAGLTRVLAIAGDSTRPRGPFATALDIIESGVLQKHGVRHVDVAGHPEGNAGFSIDEGLGFLRAKRDAAAKAGLSVGIVTQFCFDPAPVRDYLIALDKAGLDMPLRIGLAGPANPATLLKFAMRCGVGNSIMALQKHVGTIGRLLKDTGPDGVVRGIADALTSDAGARVSGFHFFPFGGLSKTTAFIAEMLREVGA